MGTVIWILAGLLACAALGRLGYALLQAGNLFSLVADALRQGDGENVVPRSLSSADRLLEPAVRKDFPEYSRALMVQTVKRDVKTYYASGQAGNVLFTAQEATKGFRGRLAGALPPAVQDVRTHKVGLCSYDASVRDRLLTYQAAVQYRNSAGTLCQVRLSLTYIAAFDENAEQDLRPLSCPHCGAPVPAIGSKACKYCGTALYISSGLGWLLMDVAED